MKAGADKGRAFRSQAAFRAWLEANHDTVAELVVRCFKVEHGDRGVTYRQALDEALCFGWIDGVRHALDEVSFTVRFTPRKPRSGWSRVNVKRAGELQAMGLMRPPGLAAFRKREAAPDPRAAPRQLDRSLPARLRANRDAWRYFSAQPPWYRRTCARWVMSAKHAATRERRFVVLVDSSAAGVPVPPLRRPGRAAAGPRTGRETRKALAARFRKD